MKNKQEQLSQERSQRLFAALVELLAEKLGDRIHDYLIPPPVFTTLQGEFLDVNIAAGEISTRFPVLESYLNPYGTLQGGMIAAAVDNTIGPLSVAVGPPNVTRSLEMKFSQPVKPEMGYLEVQARLVKTEPPRMYFEAVVLSPEGVRLAKGKAVHWILPEAAEPGT